MLIWLGTLMLGLSLVTVWNRLVRHVETADDRGLAAYGWPKTSPVFDYWKLAGHREIGRLWLRVVLFGVPDIAKCGAVTALLALFRAIYLGFFSFALFGLAYPGQFLGYLAAFAVILSSALSVLVRRRYYRPWAVAEEN